MGVGADGEGDTRLEGPLCNERIGVGDEVSLDEAAGVDFEADSGGLDGGEEALNGFSVGLGEEGTAEGVVEADDIRVSEAVVATRVSRGGEAIEIGGDDGLIGEVALIVQPLAESGEHVMEGSEDKIEGFGLEDGVHVLHEGQVRVDFGLDAIEHLDACGLAVAARGLDPFPVERQLVGLHAGAVVEEARVAHGDVAGEGNPGEALPGGRIDILEEGPGGVPAEAGVHVGVKGDKWRRGGHEGKRGLY